MNITNTSMGETHLAVPVARTPAVEEAIVGKAGKPAARLIPYGLGNEPRRPGALRRKIKTRDDFDELPRT